MTRTAMTGRLSPWTLPGLIRDLRGGRRSGLLTFGEGETKRTLRFREGRIVAAFTNVEGERLPDRLLGLGLIREAELEEALLVMRREARTLVDVLEDRGLVPRAGIERALAEQATDILRCAFAAGQGTYHFQDQAASAGEESGVEIVAENAILAALRQVADPAVVRYALGEIHRPLRLVGGLRIERLHLTTSEGFFLSRVDGTLSGREIVDLLPLDAEDARRTLLSLLCAGIVEFSGPVKAATRLADVATRAEERAVELGIAPPPPTPPPPPDSDPLVPVAPVPPSAATADMEEEVAEESLAKAGSEISAGRPAEAARILETVVDLAEGATRRKVRRLLAQALLADARSEKRGEQQLHVLVAESPDDVEAHLMLGEVYKRRGLRSRAEAMYRRVLELDPKHVGARAALVPPPEAEPRAAAGGGRIWGRILGR